MNSRKRRFCCFFSSCALTVLEIGSVVLDQSSVLNDDRDRELLCRPTLEYIVFRKSLCLERCSPRVGQLLDVLDTCNADAIISRFFVVLELQNGRIDSQTRKKVIGVFFFLIESLFVVAFAEIIN